MTIVIAFCLSCSESCVDSMERENRGKGDGRRREKCSINRCELKQGRKALYWNLKKSFFIPTRSTWNFNLKGKWKWIVNFHMFNFVLNFNLSSFFLINLNIREICLHENFRFTAGCLSHNKYEDEISIEYIFRVTFQGKERKNKKRKSNVNMKNLVMKFTSLRHKIDFLLLRRIFTVTLFSRH